MPHDGLLLEEKVPRRGGCGVAAKRRYRGTDPPKPGDERKLCRTPHQSKFGSEEPNFDSFSSRRSLGAPTEAVRDPQGLR